MGYIFDDWKKVLDSFQQSVEKDLAEIHKQKAEVQQIKNDMFEKMGQGLFYRDDSRIVISAPEIVIGNVDRAGDLQGSGRIIIKGNEISQEGVGEHGQIVSRAPSIRQLAVDPGIDGVENVVQHTSEIVSQACDIVLHSSQAKDVFSQRPVPAGKGGVRIHADNDLTMEATVSAEGRKQAIEAEVKGLNTQANDLKKLMNSQKKEMEAFFTQMNKLLEAEEKHNTGKFFLSRITLKDIQELHDRMNTLMPTLYQTTANFIHTVAQLAEVNRRKKALETEKGEIKTGDDFKKKFTGSRLSVTAESIGVTTCDGDGNLHTNAEAGITIRSPRMSMTADDGKGKLVENGGFSVNAQNIAFSSFEPSGDGKEMPVKGRVSVRAKDISVESVDYMSDDKGMREKTLTADGKVLITAKTVEVSTASPKDIERDDKGKLTKGEYTAEGDFILRSKTIAMETLDYEVKDGKLSTKALTKGSTVAVRSEKMDFLAADAEGKSTGSIAVNAKAVSVKSMDVDKEKLTDDKLAAGSTMTIVSEKLYVGAKSKDVKSKKVQIQSEEVGAFADKTLEIQQDNGKAMVQLSGGNTAVGGSKTEVYGETTINGKTAVKGDMTAPKATIDNLEAKTSFKSTNISDGIPVPAPAAPASLSAKLKTEDAPK